MSTESHLGPDARPAHPESRRASRRQAPPAPLAGYEHGPDATVRATQAALARADEAQSIVLVEGISDQVAIETLADRIGRRLADEGIVVVPIGGAQAVKHFIPRFSGKPGVKLSGLCDRSETGYFARALAEQDLIGDPTEVGEVERAGFHVCDADLEDELIRSVDDSELESVLAAEGDLGAFRTLQKQPGWRGRPFHDQMHRWLRSVARRNIRYARLLVLSASLERVPRPLLALAQRI